MEKNQFTFLLNNYTSLSAEETNHLISLQKEYPYSQIIYSLAARAAKDNELDVQEDQLHLSAIYSTDRAVLKSIMVALQQERTNSTEPIPEAIEATRVADIPVAQSKSELIKPIIVSETKIITTESISDRLPESTISLSGDALYEEVMHDLAQLKESKHQFEVAVEELEESARNSEKPTRKSKSLDPDEGLLKEIKSSKKKIKPEGFKQKEQIEIIDQFIKAQPTITKAKASTVENQAIEKEDAEDNATYSENIVSETLAEILIKQGKKEKAIEVLKKLIWKFPQKKAYFAAQIEDLKK